MQGRFLSLSCNRALSWQHLLSATEDMSEQFEHVHQNKFVIRLERSSSSLSGSLPLEEENFILLSSSSLYSGSSTYPQHTSLTLSWLLLFELAFSETFSESEEFSLSIASAFKQHTVQRLISNSPNSFEEVTRFDVMILIT